MKSHSLVSPRLTVLMPTYGRTSRLKISLASFLIQERLEDLELIILNSRPDQFIEVDTAKYPMVKVVNLGFRPVGLHEVHKMALSFQTGEYFTVLDDDDVWNPSVAQFYLDAIKKNPDIATFIPTSHLYGNTTGVTAHHPHGCSNLNVYHRESFNAVDGYSSGDYEFDQVSRIKMNKAYPNIKITPTTAQEHFIYVYGGVSFHASSTGQIPNRHAEIENRVSTLILSGKEPVGVVRIEPDFDSAWEFVAKSVLLMEKLEAVRKRKESGISETLKTKLVGRWSWDSVHGYSFVVSGDTVVVSYFDRNDEKKYNFTGFAVLNFKDENTARMEAVESAEKYPDWIQEHIDRNVSFSVSELDEVVMTYGDKVNQTNKVITKLQ